MRGEHMNRTLSKRSLFVLLVLVLTVVLGIYLGARPQLVPGQAPLTDFQNIETLCIQFNQDAGKTRLIILVSPT